MKKIVLIGVMVLLSVLLITATVACTDAKKGFTDPDLIKVDKAFNGVEQSMSEDTARNAASVRTAAFSGLKMAAMTESDALAAIRNVYESGDRQADALPEFSYDEPPMQQFRYLKAVFEEMGDDYQLGTKYYYDISGTIYFDMQTGFPVATKTAEYQYDYVFGFSMSIELKENDLIFAEVGFSIQLTHGEDVRNTSWYVSFDLNYNFESSEPTYTLSMYTDNKEGDLPYLHRPQGYELDYVNMENGAIKEWHKFSMDADREIVFDRTHSSFDDYVAEGIVYDASTCKWYDNHGYYKITRITDEKNLALATAFVDGLGMNGTAINAAAFLNKEGTVNPVIDTYYKKICSVRDGDILYDLVCKKEDKERETGGNGNGEASGANWESATENMNIPDVVPAFLTASGTFSAEYDRESNAWLISYENLGENDIQNYCDALTAAGFIHETRGDYYFVDEENDQVILIAVTQINGAIVIATVDAANSIVNVPYGLSFHGDVSGQNVTQITDTKSISDVDVLSQGFVTTDELSALIMGEGKSCIVDITVSYGENIDATAEDYAQNIAKTYGALYMNDADWTKNNDNTLCYKTLTSFDVIIIISHKVESGDPHVVIYVLLVPQGNAERIVSGDAGGESGRPDGGESGGEIGGNGEGGDPGSGDPGSGDPGSGEIGGDEKPFDPGSGDPEDPEDPNGDPSQKVTVTVNILDKHQNVESTDSLVFNNGQKINVAQFITEEGQHVYRGFYINEWNIIDSTINAYDGLLLCVWKELPKGTFRIYDVSDKETTLYNEFEDYIGSGDYFGYSFEYLLYWDESCKNQIPLDYEFNLTEEGINVYRFHNSHVDCFVLDVRCYLNGHPYDSFTEQFIYRKGKVYYLNTSAYGQSIVDFDMYRSWLGERTEFYLGEGKTESNRLDYGKYIGTAEDTLVVSIYATNDNYRVYTLKTENGTIITEDYIVLEGFDAFYYSEGMGHRFVYGNRDAGYCTVSGDVITLHDVSIMPVSLKVKYVWDGRILCERFDYPENDYYYSDPDRAPSFGGDIGPSKEFFRDVKCTDPIVLTDDGYGNGIYVVTTSMTFYSPYILPDNF